METDPKKLRQLRLNQPRMTSAEAYAQMERSLQAVRLDSIPAPQIPGGSC